MSDLEKRRNGMDVVCRGERERFFPFKPVPQLNLNCNLMSARRLVSTVHSTGLLYGRVIHVFQLGHLA